MRVLQAFINKSCIGHLSEDNDIWSFEYAQEWVADPQGYDLSPALTRRHEIYRDGSTHRPVQWFFDNLLPEEGQRTALAKEAECSDADAFGLLAYYGAESAGAVTLLPDGRNLDDSQEFVPLTKAELSQRIQAMPQIPISKGSIKKMSVAGAQEKLLVVFDGQQLYEPATQGAVSTHILKPQHPGKDYPSSVANEYFTMRLASLVGLNVPAVTLLHVPEPVYLIERFDRQAQHRLHAIDACQLLNKTRLYKYTQATVETLTQVIQATRARAAARVELFRWLCFNLLVGNGDNHLKNLSFMVGPAGIKLAPAYDLLATCAYDTRALADERAVWPQCKLALTWGETERFSQVTVDSVLEMGVMLGLSDAAAQRHLNNVISKAMGAAPQLATEVIQQSHGAQRACDQRVLDVITRIVMPDIERLMRV